MKTSKAKSPRKRLSTVKSHSRKSSNLINPEGLISFKGVKEKFESVESRAKFELDISQLNPALSELISQVDRSLAKLITLEQTLFTALNATSVRISGKIGRNFAYVSVTIFDTNPLDCVITIELISNPLDILSNLGVKIKSATFVFSSFDWLNASIPFFNRAGAVADVLKGSGLLAHIDHSLLKPLELADN